MARPKKNRRMDSPPRIIGLKPFGSTKVTESIQLLFEEWEVIRLLDYEGLNQQEAAKQLDVSRPTLTRIYEKARRKIAKALVDGNSIVIGGGDVAFNKPWFRCGSCQNSFEENVKRGRCPECSSTDLSVVEETVNDDITKPRCCDSCDKRDNCIKRNICCKSKVSNYNH